MLTSMAATSRFRSERLHIAARYCKHFTFAVTAVALAGIAFMMLSSPVRAASQPPERSLLGIKIFDKAALVLKKFGAPSKIVTSTAGTTTPGSNPAAPTVPTAPNPGEFANPGAPAQPAANGAASATADPNEVVYEYATKAGTTLDFTISGDGRVIQISAAGQKNGNVRTLRGVTLGTSYIDVINKYGYPEGQDVTNSVLTMRYVDRAHVAFQLFNQKVVSVTVAAVE